VTASAAGLAGCADVCDWRHTHRVTVTATDPTVKILAKGKSFVM
jgi:hypothetical protein